MLKDREGRPFEDYECLFCEPLAYLVDVGIVVEEHLPKIRSQVKTIPPDKEFFNLHLIPTDNNGNQNRMFMWAIFNRQSHAFKINIHFGFIIRCKETGNLIYADTDMNKPLFSGDAYIRSRVDFEQFVKDYYNADLREYLIQQYPDTLYLFEEATNIEFRVTSMAPVSIDKNVR